MKKLTSMLLQLPLLHPEQQSDVALFGLSSHVYNVSGASLELGTGREFYDARAEVEGVRGTPLSEDQRRPKRVPRALSRATVAAIALVLVTGAVLPACIMGAGPGATLTGIPADPNGTSATLAGPTVTPTTTPPGAEPSAGEVWVRSADEAEMVWVPGATYLMGSTAEEVDRALALCNEVVDGCKRRWFEDETPAHAVTLDGFWIDRTEVTNAQFALFVEATGYRTDVEKAAAGLEPENGAAGEADGPDWRHPSGPGSEVAGMDAHPVVYVSWNDAHAYCRWAGGRLPTEAEWEYAARGPERPVFPWGNEFYGSRLNYCDRNCEKSWADESADDGYRHTAPVATYPKGESWVGALDMAGNVWEWVADWYESDYYSQSPALNPPGPGSGGGRALRGGSWACTADCVRGSYRNAYPPDLGDDDAGFRCARSP